MTGKRKVNLSHIREHTTEVISSSVLYNDVQTSYTVPMQKIDTLDRNAPGLVRDAILAVMQRISEPISVTELTARVNIEIGMTPSSSIRSYLLLNTPGKFLRTERGLYVLRHQQNNHASSPSADILPTSVAPFRYGSAELYCQDCLDWFGTQNNNSIHAVVTDPPYGLQEYTPEELTKLRAGKGGVWRKPPSFDGNQRAPLPRFTVLDPTQMKRLHDFFFDWGTALLPKLVPGANVIMASNPLLSYFVSSTLVSAGLERRGEIIRLTMTMRGGDRPKNAEREFPNVSVMPRSMWEPWLIFRKPLEGRVKDNLKKWGTGGFRRISDERPFGDVIKSAPTNKSERALANHPSLKPQAFLRQIVRAALPLGTGVVVDPFAGSGSTLAAAEAVGYASKGIERDHGYYELACSAIPKLANFRSSSDVDTANADEAF